MTDDVSEVRTRLLHASGASRDSKLVAGLIRLNRGASEFIPEILKRLENGTIVLISNDIIDLYEATKSRELVELWQKCRGAGAYSIHQQCQLLVGEPRTFDEPLRLALARNWRDFVDSDTFVFCLDVVDALGRHGSDVAVALLRHVEKEALEMEAAIRRDANELATGDSTDQQCHASFAAGRLDLLLAALRKGLKHAERRGNFIWRYADSDKPRVDGKNKPGKRSIPWSERKLLIDLQYKWLEFENLCEAQGKRAFVVDFCKHIGKLASKKKEIKKDLDSQRNWENDLLKDYDNGHPAVETIAEFAERKSPGMSEEDLKQIVERVREQRRARKQRNEPSS